MKSKPWLDELTVELGDQGLPRYYVRRIVTEMKDHIEDISSEEQVMSMDASTTTRIEARMGSKQELARQANENFTRSRFSRRHPWLVFLVAPLPLFAIFVATYITGIVASGNYMEGATVNSHPTAVAILGWVCQAAVLVPAIAASVILCWIGTRSGRSWRWQLAACLLIAMLAAFCQVAFVPPLTPGGGQVSLAINLGGFAFKPLQFLVPIMIAAVFFWIHRGRRVDLEMG